VEKKTIVATCTALALVLGAGSAVFAGNDDRESGGYAIGPLGQQFGGSSQSGSAYGLAEPHYKEVRPGD
jgi:hypothetical protein